MELEKIERGVELHVDDSRIREYFSQELVECIDSLIDKTGREVVSNMSQRRELARKFGLDGIWLDSFDL